MNHPLLVSIKFYQNNGFLGVCLRKIGQLRAGAAADGTRIPHTELFSETPLIKEQIDELLKDYEISEEQKRPFRSLRKDLIFSDSENLKYDRLRKNMIAKTQHPFYSKTKKK